MNLRILKKRSKQALPILLAHYAHHLPEQMFVAERGENYHGLVIRCKHPKTKRFGCGCDYHPLKGTPMGGQMQGYYEPEWDEKTALEMLQDFVSEAGRPETMTDDDWDRALRVSRVKPTDDDREYEIECERICQDIMRMDQNLGFGLFHPEAVKRELRGS